MRKKLLKNFPVFTGRKIKMFLLSVSTINAIIFLIVLSTICTCKKDSTLNWKDFIGKWELEQLLIDGHDTTSFIKADTNCYGYTIFGISKDNAKYILQEPVRTVGTNFHCYMSGYWSYYQSISIDYNSNNNNVGPYLSGEFLSWEVLEKSENRFKLYIVYQNMPCYLTYKRKL